MDKFNGITIKEFKIIDPEYEYIQGEELWNRMEDYVAMRQKYQDNIFDSRYMQNMYPIVKVDIVNEMGNNMITLDTNLRIFSRISFFYYIVRFHSQYAYGNMKPDIQELSEFMQKCYSEIYNILHFYVVDIDFINPLTNKHNCIFDVYQGSEYHRLKLIKERNEPNFK